VLFADWIKEYGRVMIIDHGEHYCSLVAHVDRFLKKVGEMVRAGETIATVGIRVQRAAPGFTSKYVITENP